MGFSAALARQKLRDAAKLQQQDAAADKEMRPAVAHTSRAPAFLREALRRDRDALSPSLRRRLTWQQALCLAPLVDLPRLKHAPVLEPVVGQPEASPVEELPAPVLGVVVGEGMEAAPRGQEMERANEGTARGSIESLGRWNEKDDDCAMPIKMRGDVRVALGIFVDELVRNGASSGILAIRGYEFSWSASPDDTSYQRHGVYESREPAGEAGATEANDKVARLKKVLAAAEALNKAAEEAKRRAENATRFADFEGVVDDFGSGPQMAVYRVTLPSGGLDPDKWAGRPPLLSTGEISGEYSAPCDGRECCKCDNCEICRSMTVVPLGADVIETWSTSCLFCKCPPGEPVYFLGPIVAGEVRTRNPGTNHFRSDFGGTTFSARGTASGGYKKRPGSQKRTFQKVETRDLAGTWCGCLCIPKCNWVFTTSLFCTRKKALDEDRYEESGLGCALGLPIPISGTRTRQYANGLPTNRFDGYDCCGKYIIHRYRDPGCAGGGDFRSESGVTLAVQVTRNFWE